MTGEDDSARIREGDPHPGHESAAFVDAVVSQLSRGLDDAGSGAQQRVAWLTDRLASILLACERDDTEPAIATMMEDPLLLSAVFQNIDLLYASEYPYADAVSMLTLDAVHQALKAEEG